MTMKYRIQLKCYHNDPNNNKHTDIRAKTASKSEDVNITELSICKSIAESILTRTSLDRKPIISFARSYFTTIPFFLTEKDDYLAFKNENKYLLRDFSMSSRNGEIAQGISYLLAKRVLGAKTIYDYKYFLDEHNAKPIGRSPDYILVNSNGSYSIMESKGTIESNPTSRITSGMDQCENGIKVVQNVVNVSNIHVLAVSFATDSKNMTRKTCAYISTKRENQVPISENSFNWRYEYAKWFCLAGQIEDAKKLIYGKSIDLHNNYGNEGDYVVLGSWYAYNIDTIIPVKYEIGITQNTLEVLSDPDANVPPVSYDPKKGHDIEEFDDGTFIRVGYAQC